MASRLALFTFIIVIIDLYDVVGQARMGHCMRVEARRPLGGVSSPPLPFCRFLGYNLGQQACQE